MQDIAFGLIALVFFGAYLRRNCELVYSKKKVVIIYFVGVILFGMAVFQMSNSTRLSVKVNEVNMIIGNTVVEDDEKIQRKERESVNIDYPNTITEIKEFAEDVPEFLKKAIVSILLLIVAWLFVKNPIIKNYCDNMQYELYQISHKWLNEKSLKNIIISVQITVENNLCLKDICQYFDEELKNDTAKMYMILGNPGEGKTVSLNKVCEMILDKRNEVEESKKLFYKIKRFLKKEKGNSETKVQEGKVPILLSCVDIADVIDSEHLHKKVIRQIYDIANTRYIKTIVKLREKTEKIITTMIKQGKFVFLIDGYDEVVGDTRRKVCRIINDYRKENNKCSFIITSRTAVFENEMYFNIPKENILHLVPFSNDKIIEFLSQWNFSSDKKYWELYEKIINNYQLNRLAENPLLLTLIAYLYDKSKLNIPNTICEFYEESTKCLLEEWEEEKRIKDKSEIELEEKEEFLEEVSNWIAKNSKYTFSRLEILEDLDKINRYGTALKKILNEIYLQSGILEKHIEFKGKTNSKVKYKFYHRSFYEFYLAKYTVDNNIKNDEWMFDAENYRIAFFYFSLSDDKERLNRYIKANFDNLHVVEELLIECEISDSEIIRNYFNLKKKNVNGSEREYQTLGQIAAKYSYMHNEIYNYFICQFEEHIYQNINVVTYIIKAMSYFVSCEKVLELIINYIDFIEWEEFAKTPGIQLDEYYYAVLKHDIEQSYKIKLIKGLANAGQYITLYKMIKETEDDNIKNNIMIAFLQLTTEKKFIKWINNKNILQYMNKSTIKQIRKWRREYGWKWEDISDIQIEHRYLFVYILLHNYQDEMIDLFKISNRVKYVASYIQNEENEGEIKAYYVDIPDYAVVSTIEFQYHWKKNKIVDDMSYNPILLRNIMYGSCIFIVLVLLMFLLSYKTMYYDCVRHIKSALSYYRINNYDEYYRIIKALDNKKIAELNISEHIVPNSQMLIFLWGWIVIQAQTYKQYIDKAYNYLYKGTYFILAFIFVNIYFLIFEDIVFKVGGIAMAIIILLVSMTQHRHNMPAFREPLFSDIRDYLEKDLF